MIDRGRYSRSNDLDLEKLGYTLIDETIRPYIKEINELGFKTVSSCGGHLGDGSYRHPYVEIVFSDMGELVTFVRHYLGSGAGAWLMLGRATSHENALLVSLNLANPDMALKMRFKFFRNIIDALEKIRGDG